MKFVKEDPRTFSMLLGKVIPTQVEARVDQPVTCTVVSDVPRPDDASS
ncbi:MAG: hypothetical protein KAQ88_00750 [Hyphomicrobiaceae bacterium]|nr:hypothetical protein [Hyphomicrobiaceae bacterium]